MKIQKGSEEWELMSDLYTLYSLSLDDEFENREWSEKFFKEISNFKKKFKKFPIAKRFADAIEISNCERYEIYKMERWKSGK